MTGIVPITMVVALLWELWLEQVYGKPYRTYRRRLCAICSGCGTELLRINGRFCTATPLHAKSET